jgi:hypothetical protein
VDKSIYGEKFTPYATTAEHSIEVLHDYHPRIKFINLTRDGRDVIVSGAAQWLNHRLRQAPADEQAVFAQALRNHAILPEDFERFLGYWTEAVMAGLKARARFTHYLHLSYEKFLANPVRETTLLFGFIGIDASPEVVRSCVNATTFEKLSGGRRPGEEDPHSFFRKGEAGDWKNWFSQDQQQVFQRRAGNLLKQLGYP